MNYYFLIKICMKIKINIKYLYELNQNFTLLKCYNNIILYKNKFIFLLAI